MQRARRTKIVATIGPASEHPSVLRELIDAGMDMARLGLAHGPVEESIAKLQRIRAVADEASRHIGVLADLPGPKVRAGAFPADGVTLGEGSEVALVPDDTTGSDGTRIAVDYADLLEDLEPGDLV